VISEAFKSIISYQLSVIKYPQYQFFGFGASAQPSGHCSLFTDNC